VGTSTPTTAITTEATLPPPPTYRYFAHPRAPVVTTWQSEAARCDLCSRVLPGYAGPFHGERDREFVCEECLVQSKLEPAGLSTNNGDLASLRNQLEGVDDPERGRLIRERTGELEFRIPQLVRWQDWPWPACCGSARRRREWMALVSRARQGRATEGLRCLGPGPASVDFGPAVVPGRHHFRCLHCRTSVVLWDCDERYVRAAPRGGFPLLAQCVEQQHPSVGQGGSPGRPAVTGCGRPAADSWPRSAPAHANLGPP
jgi:uncharacterized protein CbrC (UPF0167 family)